jgi:hypothetical protein
VEEQGTEKRITIRMPRDLYDRLSAWAEREHRSLQGQLIHLVEQALPKTEVQAQTEPRAWHVDER